MDKIDAALSYFVIVKYSPVELHHDASRSGNKDAFLDLVQSKYNMHLLKGKRKN